METNPQRIAEFKEDIAQMGIRSPADAGERWWLIAGMALVVIGLVVIFVGYVGASGSVQPYEQLPYLLSGGFLGLGLVVAGGALFVRYSLSRYLRFWLVRAIYEDRTQTDRQVEALARIEQLLAGGHGGSPADAAPQPAAIVPGQESF